MNGAPGHGKDVVDALNATTKAYLKKKMRMVSCTGHDESDRKMKGHSISEIETTSFARECLRLCNRSDRKDGVKSFAKYGKREKAAPIQERIYHLQERNDVRFSQLKMSTTGFPKGAVHSGILSRYNLRTETTIGA